MVFFFFFFNPPTCLKEKRKGKKKRSSLLDKQTQIYTRSTYQLGRYSSRQTSVCVSDKGGGGRGIYTPDECIVYRVFFVVLFCCVSCLRVRMKEKKLEKGIYIIPLYWGFLLSLSRRGEGGFVRQVIPSAAPVQN